MQINPYLRFNDKKCREAMNFYQSVFGGELTFQTIGETPMAKEMPADKQDYIMHAALKSDKAEFFGSDMMRDKAVIGDNVAVSVDCDSNEQLKEFFAKIKVGGEVFMEPEVAFWDAMFGMVTDKYGVEWMFNCTNKK